MTWEDFLELMSSEGVQHPLRDINEEGSTDDLMDVTELVQTGSLTVRVNGKSYVVSLQVQEA